MNIIIGIISAIIPVLISYFLWGRKANELYDLQIEEKRENKYNKLKAKVKITDLGRGYFEIKNCGNVVAQNVDIAHININKNKVLDNKHLPYKALKPEQGIRIRIDISNLKKLKIKLCWEDEYGEKFNEPRELEKKIKL